MASPMEVDGEASRRSKAEKGKGIVSDQGGATQRNMEYLKTAPWVEKYRPKSLADVAAHKDIVSTIERLTQENKLPHLLLYGPPGTGKTSTILAVARQMYGQAFRNMILELNASDDRGIDVVRQQIQDFASTQSIGFGSKLKVKLVILDEADAMTKDAQFSLRRIIEKYTRNTRFCLICNYVSKIIPALQSRCTRFRFAPLKPEDVTARLKIISSQEGLDITEGALKAVVRLSAGDMRRSLNILQSCHMAHEHISEEDIYSSTGSPMPQDIQRIRTWLLNKPFSDVYKELNALKLEKGLALVDVIRQLHEQVTQIEMPAEVRIGLIEAMADIEYRLSFATNEKLQMSALIGAFVLARDQLVKAAK